jgi:hypothetical protein
MNRLTLAAIIGGIVAFLWGAVSHMVLPIGKMGLRSLPSEASVLATLQGSVPEPGLYFFPGMDFSRSMTPEEETAWQERYRSGPAGLLVYRPKGGEAMSPWKLLTELLSSVLAAGAAAFVVAPMAASYGRRVLATACMGLFAWFSMSLSYWNWYGFPTDFIVAEGIDQVAGWFLAGLAIAKIAPRPRY